MGLFTKSKNARVITVATKKGGVGKTSLACNMSVGLDALGYKVAAIDMDSQGHLARSFGVNKLKLKETMYNVLLGENDMKDIKTSAFGVDLYLSNNDLSEFEDTVNSPDNKQYFPNTHVLLKEAVDQIRTKYDYIIIDTPPSTKLDTLNALIAATDVIIPVLPEGLALDGVLDMLDFIKKVQKKEHPTLNLMGILPTMVQPTTLHGDVLRELKLMCTKLGIKVYDAQIKRTIKHGVAQTYGTPAIVDPEAKKTANEEYMKFIKEALEI